MSAERNAPAMDQSRKTIYLAVAIVSLLLIVSLGYCVTRPKPKNAMNAPRLENALRAGSPDFEKYRELIRLDDPEATEASRVIGDIVMTLKTTVRNFTGRTINGLAIRATVVDSQNQPIKERTVVVIPTRQAELEPNKTMEVPVVLEGFSKKDDRANIKMEMTAVRFK